MAERIKYEPIEVAIAMSLYAYNVSPMERAEKLYAHFRGACAELGKLVRVMSESPGYAATELAFPTAELYVGFALERYGEEARERVRIERLGFNAALDAYEQIKDEAAEEAANAYDAEEMREAYGE